MRLLLIPFICGVILFFYIAFFATGGRHPLTAALTGLLLGLPVGMWLSLWYMRR